MAEQWYYARQGQRMGPVPEEQLLQLVQSGQVQATDLVWKQGLAEWTPAGKVFPASPPDPAAPPPVPLAPGPAGSGPAGAPAPIDWVALLDLNNHMLVGYRVALLVAMLAALLPWASGTILGASWRISGMNTVWGVLTLLVALGGIVFTFLRPRSIVKDKVQIAMAGRRSDCSAGTDRIGNRGVAIDDCSRCSGRADFRRGRLWRLLGSDCRAGSGRAGVRKQVGAVSGLTPPASASLGWPSWSDRPRGVPTRWPGTASC